MFLKLGPVEIILINAVNTKFKLGNISALSLDGVKSVWVRIEGKKYHGYWTGNEVNGWVWYKMTCKFKELVPGDCHISCTRNFKEGEMVPYPFVKALQDLPYHAGMYPFCFNEYFVCPKCPESDEEKK